MTGAASASSSLSRSSGVATAKARASGTVRLASPVSTPPGPISTKVVVPDSARRNSVCRHRTGLHSWALNNAGQSAAESWALASTLAMTVTSGSWVAQSEIALRKRSRAGAMNGVWKAPLTGSGMAFLAPRPLAAAMAASTESGSPASTTWPGAL